MVLRELWIVVAGRGTRTGRLLMLSDPEAETGRIKLLRLSISFPDKMRLVELTTKIPLSVQVFNDPTGEEQK